MARPPSLCAVHVSSLLYRRVSTRVRIGVWAPDGRSTLVRPPLVADPFGGSAKPQYGISKNLIVVIPIFGVRVTTQSDIALASCARTARENTLRFSDNRKQEGLGPEENPQQGDSVPHVSHTGKTRESNIYGNQCDGSRLAQGEESDSPTRKGQRSHI